MGAVAKVIIDKGANGGIFTNGDIIQGKAVIHVTDSVDVSEVIIKFEAVSKATISYTQPRSQSSRRVYITNKHRVVSQIVTVFPSAKERAVMSQSEFTLAEGTYVYPFSFKIPMNNACIDNIGKHANRDSPDSYSKIQDHGKLRFHGAFTREKWGTRVGGNNIAHLSYVLPPTFELSDRAKVDYHIKVVVMNLSTFSRRIKASESFQFMPVDVRSPSPAVNNDIRSYFTIGGKKIKPIKCCFGLKLNTPYLVPGKPIDTTIFVAHETGAPVEALIPIYIEQVKFKLVSSTDLRSIEKKLTNKTMHKIYVMDETVISNVAAHKLPIEFSSLKERGQSNSLALPAELYSCVLPKFIVPTFESCNISRTYRLEVSILYSFDMKAQSGFFATLKGNSLLKAKLVSDEILVKSGMNPTIQPPQFSHLTEVVEEELPMYTE